jgi:hypothetical protein
VKQHVLDAYPETLLPDVYTWPVYRWAHAILDSRSIWWDGERHLVPLLDLINCQQGPAGSTIHSTNSSPDGSAADTLAPWSFAEGEQLFENYGQPNHIYFTYHGFSLDENDSNCVRVRVDVEEAAAARGLSTVATAELMDSVKSATGARSTVITPCVSPTKRPSDVERRFIQMAYGLPRTSSWSAALARVAKLAEDALAVFGESAEQDAALLATGIGLTDNARAAVTYRMHEKLMLRQVVQAWGGAVGDTGDEL